MTGNGMTYQTEGFRCLKQRKKNSVRTSASETMENTPYSVIGTSRPIYKTQLHKHWRHRAIFKERPFDRETSKQVCFVPLLAYIVVLSIL